MGTASFGTVERLLIRSVNWIGDAVMTVPALKEIRRLFPDARIDLAARPWVGGLFERAPYVDRVVPYDKGGPHKGLRGRWRFARETLAPERYDLAILLQNAIEAALLVWLARVPRRLGYPTDGRRLLLTDRVPESTQGRHQTLRYLQLLAGLSDVDYLADGYRPDISLGLDADLAADGDRLLARRELALAGPLVVMHAGAAFGPGKRWPPERFGALGARLVSERGATVVLIGGPAEKALAAEVQAASAAPLVDLVGETSLDELLGLLARADLVVANDSGPMHLAASLDRPLVALFGSTDDVATGPLCSRVRVIHKRVECSPCFERECPLGHLDCFTRIAVDEVVEAAGALLS